MKRLNQSILHLLLITLTIGSFAKTEHAQARVEAPSSTEEIPVYDFDMDKSKILNESEIEVAVKEEFPIGIRQYKLNENTVIPCKIGNCRTKNDLTESSEKEILKKDDTAIITSSEQIEETPIFVVDESIEDENDTNIDIVSRCKEDEFLKQYEELFSTHKAIQLAGDSSDVIDVNLEQLTEEVANNKHNIVSHEELIAELFAKLQAGTLSKEAKDAIVEMMKILETSDGSLSDVNLEVQTKNLPSDVAHDLNIINQLKIDALLGGMQPETMMSLSVMEQVITGTRKNPEVINTPEISELLRTHQTRLMKKNVSPEKIQKKESKETLNEKEELALTNSYLQQISEGQAEIQQAIKDPNAQEKQEKREGFFKNIYQKAKDKFIEASHYTKEKFAKFLDNSKEKFATSKEYSKSKYAQLKEFSKEKWAKLSAESKPAFQKAKEKSKELYSKTKDKVAQLISAGKDKYQTYKENRQISAEIDIQAALDKPAVFTSKKDAQIHALTSPEKAAYYVKDKKVYSVDKDAKVKRVLKPLVSVQTFAKEKQADFIMKRVTNEDAHLIYADLKSYKHTLDEKYKAEPTNPEYLIELHRLNKFYSMAINGLKTASQEAKEAKEIKETSAGKK